MAGYTQQYDTDGMRAKASEIKALSGEYEQVMSRLTIVGAIFLAIIATMPTLLSVMAPGLRGIQFGGTSLLIAVGVALDSVRQLENQMLMRNYQGFLK